MKQRIETFMSLLKENGNAIPARAARERAREVKEAKKWGTRYEQGHARPILILICWTLELNLTGGLGYWQLPLTPFC